MNEKIPTVLLIEDDEMTVDVYKRVLSNQFNFLYTSSVNEFYQLCSENNVDCFLIDLSLGLQKSGLTLIKELREDKKYFNTPIIVVTAHAFARDEKICLEAGATKFLRKPIENQRLLSEVKLAIEKSLEEKIE